MKYAVLRCYLSDLERLLLETTSMITTDFAQTQVELSLADGTHKMAQTQSHGVTLLMIQEANVACQSVQGML